MFDDFLKWAWRAFAVLRGPVSAFALVAIVDDVFGWERFRFLEFTHAVITHWNLILGQIFEPIFRFVPEPLRLGDVGRNMLMLQLAWLPLAARMLFSFWSSKSILAHSLATFLMFNVALVPWMAEPAFSSSTIRWIPVVIVSVLVLCTIGIAIVKLFEKDEDFERLYAHGMIFGLLFLGTLELLYWIPSVANAAEGFVQSSARMDAVKSD